MTDREAKIHFRLLTPKVEPALKANQPHLRKFIFQDISKYAIKYKLHQPHHSMKSPIQALAGRPIGGSPCRSQRPRRGPIILAATNAVIANGNKIICKKVCNRAVSQLQLGSLEKLFQQALLRSGSHSGIIVHQFIQKCMMAISFFDHLQHLLI